MLRLKELQLLEIFTILPSYKTASTFWNRCNLYFRTQANEWRSEIKAQSYFCTKVGRYISFKTSLVCDEILSSLKNEVCHLVVNSCLQNYYKGTRGRFYKLGFHNFRNYCISMKHDTGEQSRGQISRDIVLFNLLWFK